MWVDEDASSHACGGEDAPPSIEQIAARGVLDRDPGAIVEEGMEAMWWVELELGDAREDGEERERDGEEGGVADPGGALALRGARGRS